MSPAAQNTGPTLHSYCPQPMARRESDSQVSLLYGHSQKYTRTYCAPFTLKFDLPWDCHYCAGENVVQTHAQRLHSACSTHTWSVDSATACASFRKPLGTRLGDGQRRSVTRGGGWQGTSGGQPQAAMSARGWPCQTILRIVELSLSTRRVAKQKRS